MGRELLRAAKKKRHAVTFVECPQDAETAQELQKKLTQLLPRHDVLIMAAAVCDARPLSVIQSKIKKESLSNIRLVKNPDILAVLSKKKKKSQAFIGFGIESSDLLKNGLKKLKNKRLELIVLQEVKRNNTPFGPKRVQAYFLKKDGNLRRFPAISKRALAERVVSEAELISRAKTRD